jgi:hypothetical protein
MSGFLPGVGDFAKGFGPGDANTGDDPYLGAWSG